MSGQSYEQFQESIKDLPVGEKVLHEQLRFLRSENERNFVCYDRVFYIAQLAYRNRNNNDLNTNVRNVIDSLISECDKAAYTAASYYMQHLHQCFVKPISEGELSEHDLFNHLNIVLGQNGEYYPFI